MASIDDAITAAVANSNLKTIGETSSHLSNVIMGNLINHQQSMNTISQAAVGRIVKNLTEIDPEEAQAINHLQTNNSIAAAAMNLAAGVTATAQYARGIQLTPPPMG